MNVADEVRSHFPGRKFGPPCPGHAIARAEEALGERLPTVLRELYAAFDGFLGPTGSVFFWPLVAPRSGAGGLVDMNLFLRGNDEVFPHDLVSRCLFFGDNGLGPHWGVHRDYPGQVIQWDASWGPRFGIAGANPLDAWLAAQRFYDEVASTLPRRRT